MIGCTMYQYVPCFGHGTCGFKRQHRHSTKPHGDFVPVVPAPVGAEVALGLYYKTFLIYRTCMRRAPARPVRACFVRRCCGVVTIVVQEHDLRATPAQCNEKRTLSSHFKLHSSHFTLALHTPHFISSHLISALLTSYHFISPLIISSHLFSHVI